MSTVNVFQPAEHFLCVNSTVALESGSSLNNPVIAYQTWGNPACIATNVVWVCHALTGNHRVQEWWSGLFGPGKCFDPANSFIVCVNVPGSCYGTTGPVNFDGASSDYLEFPLVTIRDAVTFLELVRQELQIEKIHTLIGASLGGQQVLEWTVRQPGLAQTIIPIATNAFHSPFGIAFNEAQRLAIEADPTFYEKSPDGGRNGMIAARSVAMLSYRTYEGYQITQREESADVYDNYKASSYQRYQGEKLAGRFNAYTYWYLSKMMDSHNLGRGRKPVSEVLNEIQVPALVIGVDSDLLFPITEQRFLAEHIPGAELGVLSSPYGHDGFLVEFGQLTLLINEFLNKQQPEQEVSHQSALQTINK